VRPTFGKEANDLMPFDLSSLGKLLLLFAVFFGAVGLLLIIMGNVPFLGKLPGDLVIRRGGVTFFFPIVTCIVLSIVLTVLINLVFWIFRR
jgi:hypothetical protein